MSKLGIGIIKELAMSKLGIGIIFVWLFIWAFPSCMMIVAPDLRWSFKQSPQTGICYEVYEVPVIIDRSFTMSPVDDSYCEEAK